MTRVMYDSTNIQDDPLDAQLVGYYIDGIYAVSAAPVIARFPHAVLVPISAIGTNAGIVGDVEPGCMTVAEAVAWVQMRRAAGFDPSLYVNEMHGWAPVRYAFRSAGIPEPHYWVANYDGLATIPAGAVAKQYANPTLTHGHFDLSVVADFWPGVDGLFSGGSGSLVGEEVTPQENKALVILAYLAAGGRTPETQTVIDNWANSIHANGDNTDQVIANLVNSPEFIARRGEVNAVVAAGPAQPPLPGPKGDKGDPGQDGAPGKDGVVPPGTSFILNLTGKTS